MHAFELRSTRRIKRIATLISKRSTLRAPDQVRAENMSQAMTAQRFKSALRSQGKTIHQWAEKNGFPPTSVYRALNGIDKGNFGRAHDILVRAGIKQPDQRLAA